MRCVARGLIVALLTVCLCLYVALTSTNVQHPDYDQAEDDEVARLLEGSDVPSTTSKPQTSLSAIIVVITCLIIISILIAGIIVVAMTMDPMTGEESLTDDEESSILYPDLDSSPSKVSFHGLRGYDSMFDDEISCREL